MELVFDLDEIENAAKNFLRIAKDYRVFAFSGQLGAGKTTFISALCKQLGVTETISSPTYSIIQEYADGENNSIYHIDLYRIKSREEAIDAGIEDCINGKELCMVEWPEKEPSLFPEKTLYTTLEVLSEKERKLLMELP